MMSGNLTSKKGRMSKKMKEVLKDAIEKLSEEYKFSREDGENLLGLNEKKKKKGKPSVPLPWTGEVCSDWCKGVRPSHGLYSQCTNAPAKGEEYCKTCQKKDDMPTVENRDEWMSANGKKTKHYSSFLKKKGICREEADREAARFGLTIPESEYEEKGSSRGRPRKTAATSDTDESEDEGAIKKRGRPRKKSEELDMFAQLVAENAAEEAAAEKAVAAEEVTTSENFIPAGWPEETKKAEPEMSDTLAEMIALNEKAEETAMNREAEKAKRKEEKAKLKAEKEAAKEEKAKLKAEKEAAKAEKAKLAEEKAKLAEERKLEREERRKKKEGKKKATNGEVVANDEVVAENEAVAEDEERKKKMAEIFDETTEEENVELVEEEYKEEVSVKSWEHNGVKYLLNSETGDVYDRKTQEHIGVWNGEEIEEVESESESEDEE